jgi:maltose-binding protein MalE
MKKAVVLISAVAMLAACNNMTATPDTAPEGGNMPATSKQDEVAKQKLTIEQAAEEATKLIEEDAKAEIEAATSIVAEPAK